MTIDRRAALGGLAAVPLALAGRRAVAAEADPSSLLNVSYDVSRELFAAINPAFVASYAGQAGRKVEVHQSHGGSSAQARSVLEGLEADVVTLNQVTNVQVLHDRGGLIGADWRSRFPNRSSPYYSFPGFLVREGNPLGVRDWPDLARAGVKVVLPNPKTSGNARYSYLAATASALEANGGDEAAAAEVVRRILANVPIFDTGGRGATTTFVERRIGDVLVTFESEMRMIRQQYGDRGFETVTPAVSVKAEFPVAVIDAVVDRRGSRDLATAYLGFLYTPEGQEILARFGNRVRDEAVAARHAADFPPVRLVTVEDRFGSWEEVTRRHFAEGGVLERLLARR